MQINYYSATILFLAGRYCTRNHPSKTGLGLGSDQTLIKQFAPIYFTV